MKPRTGTAHKKRRARFSGYTLPKEVILLQRAARAEPIPRLTPAWLRSVSAITRDCL